MTRALVLFGVCALTAGTALAQVPLWESTGAQPNDGWGWASDSIGDLNGDGRRELVVSSSPYGPAQSGRVEVLSGATGAVLMSLFSPASNDRFGEVVARVGRVDADAFDDFLVSAPASSSAGFFAGTVRVYSGASGGVLHQFDGASQGDRWGSTADGCGDINGDGHDDIIVGSAVALQHSVKVYSGLDGSVLHTLTEPATQFYGIHVAGVGDVDNDGRADFAITSTIGAFTPGGPSAFVDVHSGASGARIVRLNGGYLFGLSVDGVGDVDNDGFDDIVVGEQGPASEPTPSAPGKVIVYSSRLWSVLHTFRGHPRTFAPGYDALGWRVQGVGDVDGDGRGDVGAIAALGQYARIWSSTSGALLTEYREHVLPSGFSLSSFSLAGLGDIDGDGRAEVAFSWSGSDAPGAPRASRRSRRRSDWATAAAQRVRAATSAERARAARTRRARAFGCTRSDRHRSRATTCTSLRPAPRRASRRSWWSARRRSTLASAFRCSQASARLARRSRASAPPTRSPTAASTAHLACSRWAHGVRAKCAFSRSGTGMPVDRAAQRPTSPAQPPSHSRPEIA
jgi:hypothetical protein